MSNVYVRVEGDDEWRLLGRTDEVTFVTDTELAHGRAFATSNSYYIELKP